MQIAFGILNLNIAEHDIEYKYLGLKSHILCTKLRVLIRFIRVKTLDKKLNKFSYAYNFQIANYYL